MASTSHDAAMCLGLALRSAAKTKSINPKVRTWFYLFSAKCLLYSWKSCWLDKDDWRFQLSIQSLEQAAIITFSILENDSSSMWHQLALRELGIHLLLQHSKLTAQRAWHAERARTELLRQLELSIEYMKEACFGCIGLASPARSAAELVATYASAHQKIFKESLPYHLSSPVASATDILMLNTANGHDIVGNIQEIDKLLLPANFAAAPFLDDNECARKAAFDSQEACTSGPTLLPYSEDLHYSLADRRSIGLEGNPWVIYSTPQSYAVASSTLFIEQGSRPRSDKFSKELTLAAQALEAGILPLPLPNTIDYPRFTSRETDILLIGVHSHSVNNYCHFLLDFLPAILLAADDLALEAGGKILAISDSIKRQYAQVYQHISASRGWSIVAVPRYAALLGYCKVSIPNLQHHPLGLDRSSALCAIREFFLADHLIQSSPSDLCIYVRRPLGCRGIINEKEMLAMLYITYSERLVVYDSSYHSLAIVEQARFFSAASVVIGPHGAGLSNIVFCRPGTLVVELAGPRWYMPTFKKAAEAADLRFISLSNPEGLADNSGHFADINVDLGRLMSVITSA